MSRALWWNPAVGVAGDMLLASLLDLGADETFVRSQLAQLPLDGWQLSAGPTTRRGLLATAVDVRAPAHDHHRPWTTIDTMLADATLDPTVTEGARRTFRRLGEAEAAVHGIDIDEVHFHEVGAVDAIVDIVGTWAALTSLDVGSVHSGPVGLGTGTARMAHGTVPIPAPATLELLIGFPSTPVETDTETATPTGVALLTTMARSWGHLPAGRIEAVGRGAGGRDPESHANLVTAVLVDTTSADHGHDAAADGQATTVRSTVLETNVDDVTPEVIGHVIEQALALGADDAWATAITMKKSRPAQQLGVLCRPELTATLRELLARETGTLGLREWQVDKHELTRRLDRVVLDGHRVQIKVGPHGAKAEHDDLVAASAATGRPVRDLAVEAVATWREAVSAADSE